MWVFGSVNLYLFFGSLNPKLMHGGTFKISQKSEVIFLAQMAKEQAVVGSTGQMAAPVDFDAQIRNLCIPITYGGTIKLSQKSEVGMCQ